MGSVKVFRSAFNFANSFQILLQILVIAASIQVLIDCSFAKDENNIQTRYTMSIITLISSFMVLLIAFVGCAASYKSSEFAFACNTIGHFLFMIIFLIAGIYLLLDQGNAYCSRQQKVDLLVERQPSGQVKIKPEFLRVSESEGARYIADDDNCIITGEEGEGDLSFSPKDDILKAGILGVLSCVSAFLSFISVGASCILFAKGKSI